MINHGGASLVVGRPDGGLPAAGDLGVHELHRHRVVRVARQVVENAGVQVVPRPRADQARGVLLLLGRRGPSRAEESPAYAAPASAASPE
jgi:hypothetical protein